MPLKPLPAISDHINLAMSVFNMSHSRAGAMDLDHFWETT